MKLKEKNLEDKRIKLHDQEKKSVSLNQNSEEKSKIMSAKFDEIESLRTELEAKVAKVEEERLVTENYMQKLKDEMSQTEKRSLEFDRHKDEFLKKFRSRPRSKVKRD